MYLPLFMGLRPGPANPRHLVAHPCVFENKTAQEKLEQVALGIQPLGAN